MAQVKASGHRREVMQTGAQRLTDFLDDIGVLRGRGPQAVASARACWPEAAPAWHAPRGSPIGSLVPRRHRARCTAAAVMNGTRHRTLQQAPTRLPQAERRAAAQPAARRRAGPVRAPRARGRLAGRRRATPPGSPGRWSTATSPAASSSCTRPRCAPPPTSWSSCFAEPQTGPAHPAAVPRPGPLPRLRRRARRRVQRAAPGRQRRRDLPYDRDRRRGAAGRGRADPAAPGRAGARACGCG